MDSAAAAEPAPASPADRTPTIAAVSHATDRGEVLQAKAVAAGPEKNTPGTPEHNVAAQPPPSVVAATRTLDLLGRLAEPLSAQNQGTSGGQAAPEFQRALQAQVERGIEQAAQQAAAAGSWAGIGLGSSGSVTLRLHPANLGMMRVYLRMDTEGGGSGGGVRARFEVSNSRTKGLLGSSMASLRSALESRGLTVADVSVTEMAQLPARDLGLPPLSETPMEDGPEFAGTPGVGNFCTPDRAGSDNAGGACATDAAETDRSDVPGTDFRWEGGGRPVALAALSARSPLSIGEDGRIFVNALV